MRTRRALVPTGLAKLALSAVAFLTLAVMALSWTQAGASTPHHSVTPADATTTTTPTSVVIPSQCQDPAVTSTSGSLFTATETLCRVYFDQGGDPVQMADERTFQLKVDQTTSLRNGQVINVSWTGAHPTGAIFEGDPQLAGAAQEEYPVVIMECRGTEAQVSPSSCWTNSVGERNVTDTAPVPMWNLDHDNSPAQQGTYVNYPTSNSCSPASAPSYEVPFVGVDYTYYGMGPEGCAGAPTEMATAENPNEVPGDTTYAATAPSYTTGSDGKPTLATNQYGDPTGTGSDKFVIETSESIASLGCSQTVPCSLVVVPIEGISCNYSSDTFPPNTYGDQYNCENSGDFAPGSLNNQGSFLPPAESDEGSYWFSESNWGRRIAVPLNFTIPNDACAQSTGSPLQFYGSELMTQATQQWNPYFCLNPKLFNVEQVQLGEPEAKGTLSQGSIEAAIEGAPPQVPTGQSTYFTTPTVQAPIGLTGFAIAYSIDNGDGTPYTQLRLDPRLLAKLMTESYYGTNNVQSGDLGIASNPASIFDDPEFLALNPTFSLPHGGFADNPAPAATLFSILTQSDVIWSLTSYINSDPEARAWLNGDSTGEPSVCNSNGVYQAKATDPCPPMVVNPAYKGIKLPVQAWPLLDTSANGPDYNPAYNQCAAVLGTGNSRVPDRPLIDNPQDTLANVAYNIEYGVAASLLVCNGGGTPTATIAPLGAEFPGNRFLIGLVSLPAAVPLDLQTAELQTYAPPEPARAPFGTGRVFQAPSNASLLAAAKLLQPSTKLGSWVLPYGDFQKDSAAQDAYPGTMLMSADIPTSNLPATDATEYGDYLTFAATQGQTPGFGTGQLPAGYLPMTAANGLGAEVAYTKTAAADVTAQNGIIPPLVAPPTTTPPKTTTTTTTTVPSRGSVGTIPLNLSPTTLPPTTSTTVVARSTATPTVPPVLIEPASAAVGRTTGFDSGLGGLALPLALLVALLGGGVATVAWWRRGQVT